MYNFKYSDEVGRVVCATIIEKLNSNFKIHYDGWNNKWDCFCDYTKEIDKIFKAGTISRRPAHRFKGLKKQDFIDVNPSMRHPGWRTGEIRRLDPKSGQVQIVYKYQNNNFLYWVHLDNDKEVAQFQTKAMSISYKPTTNTANTANNRSQARKNITMDL